MDLLASGRAPSVITPHLCGATLLASKKKNGGHHPIAVGEVLRRSALPPLCIVRPSHCSVLCSCMGVGVRGLTNLVRAAKTWLAWSGEGHPMASWRWFGRRPDGPGAEPLGKDLTPLQTAGSEAVRGGGTGPGDRVDWGA